MYESLIGQTIDKNRADFEDFPITLDGQVYLAGDSTTGWKTGGNLTETEELLLAKAARIEELKEEAVMRLIADEVAAIDSAKDVAAVKFVALPLII